MSADPTTRKSITKNPPAPTLAVRGYATERALAAAAASEIHVTEVARKSAIFSASHHLWDRARIGRRKSEDYVRALDEECPTGRRCRHRPWRDFPSLRLHCANHPPAPEAAGGKTGRRGPPSGEHSVFNRGCGWPGLKARGALMIKLLVVIAGRRRRCLAILLCLVSWHGWPFVLG